MDTRAKQWATSMWQNMTLGRRTAISLLVKFSEGNPIIHLFIYTILMFEQINNPVGLYEIR